MNQISYGGSFDLVILTHQSSDPVSYIQFEYQLEAITEILTKANFNLKKMNVYVHSYEIEDSKTKKIENKINLVENLKSWVYPTDLSDTIRALETAESLLNTEQENRNRNKREDVVPKIVLFITESNFTTDKSSYSEIFNYIAKLKEDGVNIITIGLKDNVDQNQLAELASEPSNQKFIHIKDTKILIGLSDDLAELITTWHAFKADVDPQRKNVSLEAVLDKDELRYFKIELDKKKFSLAKAVKLRVDYTGDVDAIYHEYDYDMTHPQDFDPDFFNCDTQRAESKSNWVYDLDMDLIEKKACFKTEDAKCFLFVSAHSCDDNNEIKLTLIYR